MTEYTYKRYGPPLIHGDGYSGYFLADIKEYLEDTNMNRIGAWVEFQNWYHGQTGAIHEGKLLVYEHDWNAFQNGEKNYD